MVICTGSNAIIEVSVLLVAPVVVVVVEGVFKSL